MEVLQEDIDCLRLDPLTIQEVKRSLRLPTKGKGDLVRCAFLKGRSVCKVYERRSGECKGFPIWSIEGRAMVTFVVSYICPRAEPLAVYLKEELPDWAKDLLNGRPYRVVLI